MRPPFPARRDPRTPWLGFHPAWKWLLRPAALFRAQPATLYWVGGTGNWSDGAHWALYSGGPGSGYTPTSETNLRFDANSGAGTTTIDVAVSNRDLDFTGYTGTLAASAQQNIYGNVTLAAGMITDDTGAKFFVGTGNKTIAFAGKSAFGSSWNFDGAGSTWTFQDAITIGGNVSITNGTIDTNGQAFSFFGITQSAGTFTLTLGASTLTCIGNWTMSGGTLTVNAGTSTINLTTANAFFTGAGKVYNIVNFTSSSGGARGINSANTFATLTITSGATITNTITLGADQIVTGTFTLVGNSVSNRPLILSNTVGTARTITAAAVSVTDVDFQDIAGAGVAAPFTGTRLGDCKGNSGISFTAAANKFWVGNGADWAAANVWALTSGGAGATNNYPLPQDTALLDASSFSANGQTLTSAAPRVGGIDWSAVTKTGIIWQLNGHTTFYGNMVLLSGLTTTGATLNFTFSGRAAPQTITAAGVVPVQNLVVDSFGGTVRLLDAFTIGTARTVTLTNGTLDLNGKAVSAGLFSSSNSNTRSLTCGGTTLTLTGNAGIVWTTATATNFVLNDTAQVNLTYSGAAGTRSISHVTGAVEGNSPHFRISAGTDIIDSHSGGGATGNLDFTGFSGSWGNANATIYGSLTLSATMSAASAVNTLTFAATSGTKVITTNTVTLDRPITINGAGGTFQLADNLTQGATRNFLLSGGILDLNGKTLVVGNFFSNTSTARTIKSSVAGGLLKTTSVTSIPFQISLATGMTIDRTGNNWSIEISGNTATVRTVSLTAGNQTLPALVYSNTTAGSGLDFTGTGNTFKSLSYTGGTAQTIRFTAGTTTTIEDAGGFFTGTAGNVITYTSISAANHNLVKSGGGVVSRDFLSISRSQATPATPKTWFAGHNSTDGGNNTGWVFTGDGTASPQAGTLSFIGAIAKRLPLKALTAALSFIGNIATSFIPHVGLSQALTATLSFIGAQTKRTSHLESAALSFIGAVAKRTATARTAALALAGACLKSAQVPKTATLALAGAVTKRTSRPLAATLALAGICLKSAATARTATLALAGSLAKRTGKALAGALSFVGVWTRVFTVIRAFAATLSFTGVFSRSFLFRMALTAALAFSGLMESARSFRRWILHVLRRAARWSLPARPTVWHQSPRSSVWRLPRRGPPRW